MKNLSETNELTFLKEEDAVAFFDNVCSTDVWKPCYTKELRAVPIDNAPILEQCIREQMLIPPEVSTESIQENMESINIGLQIPFDAGYVCYPLGDTAYDTLVQRAGFQNSPVLLITKDKVSQTAMSPKKKAEVINTGLSCYKNLSLILVRDEKIRAVLSGDEHDYSVLPFDQLLSTLKTRLCDMFSDVAFEAAFASHIYFMAEYSFKSSFVNETALAFNRIKSSSTSVKLSLKLISSDVGVSGANLFPYVSFDDISFMMGMPITLTHKHKHALVDFIDNITKVGAAFRDATEKMEEMNSRKVSHPGGCLMRIAKQAGLPKKLSCEEAESIEALYGTNCMQSDVFFSLYDVLDKYDAECTLSLSRRLILEEGISRITFSRFSDYDIPFQWE